MLKYEITQDFCGGNILVENICENYAKVKINYRDSEPWCYWAFKVKGASGCKITFDFGEDAVGYFGPAISYNLVDWHWSEPDRYKSDEKDRFSFEYEFSENEDEVYFAHNCLYMPDNFKKLDFLKQSVFCTDSDGTECLMGEMGDGEKIILLTARHHACEAPANYVLEGVLRELNDKHLQGYKIVTVPFMDTRGVVCGDQGKGRMPHDHNRDYIADSIYPTVKRMKEFLEVSNVKYVFDFHSPCHLGGGNNLMSLVNAYEKFRDEMNLFSSLFSGEITDNGFLFIDGVITWRPEPLEGTFSAYVGCLDPINFVATIECPYFGEEDNIMTPDRYIETGRAFARAIIKFTDSF